MGEEARTPGTRMTLEDQQIVPGPPPSPISPPADTTPCRVTPVILHRVVLCKVTPVFLHGVVSPEPCDPPPSFYYVFQEPATFGAEARTPGTRLTLGEQRIGLGPPSITLSPQIFT